jgi:hypothetical protein
VTPLAFSSWKKSRSATDLYFVSRGLNGSSEFLLRVIVDLRENVFPSLVSVDRFVTWIAFVPFTGAPQTFEACQIRQDSIDTG